MGTVYIVAGPALFNKLWSMISPFMDPVTAGKFVFVKGPTGKGGGADFESLSEAFDDEFLAWLRAEIAENAYGNTDVHVGCAHGAWWDTGVGLL